MREGCVLSAQRYAPSWKSSVVYARRGQKFGGTVIKSNPMELQETVGS